ncbi:hypothetical protein H5S40_10485 [Limosilactobacillus sp. RRLNB_1_1]|uniref:Uncharacterized protein n=2 Tax=Limosilactobacillus TaxID=2742598 RepID=A0A7W3Y9K1_9LACO|nr:MULTISPECIES: hypothetical protein [Limosilactobacillus]MRH47308.1 hypothetical protein [Limosilactobacillus reuteri]MBB1070572.1 hypothetical protein [Limosilactobacillus albertensis]MBB1122507.1 hypothetical protein [Limosilactobacillus albertensis]MCD7118951.1 hypothetical protein [Limosilactobacillus albertensis]MCD7121471.1 hypothetical protein [Limosilactobacillus albertensis]
MKRKNLINENKTIVFEITYKNPILLLMKKSKKIKDRFFIKEENSRKFQTKNFEIKCFRKK